MESRAPADKPSGYSPCYVRRGRRVSPARRSFFWLASDEKTIQEDNKERIMATMKERSARKRERQERLVEAIKANPNAEYSELARTLGVPLHIVRNDLSELMKKGTIERRKNERTRIGIDERRRAVLDLLLDDPDLTCPEIARRLKITTQVAQNDRYLLQHAGLVKKRRQSKVISKELLAQASNLDDFEDSVLTSARKLGVPLCRLLKAREVLRCRFLVEKSREDVDERDFRERQKANYNTTSRLCYKGYACFGFMGVNLPREEHKRWLALHNLRKKGLQWTPDGVIKIRGEKRRTAESFASVWKVGEKMRKSGFKTELQAQGYGYNER
jgi:Mn-dependent DtxR family transcriptional regulator